MVPPFADSISEGDVRWDKGMLICFSFELHIHYIKMCACYECLSKKNQFITSSSIGYVYIGMCLLLATTLATDF